TTDRRSRRARLPRSSATRASSRSTSGRSGGRGRTRSRPVLEVKGLTAGYAGSEVLHGVDLRVGEGEGVVVLGPNGHGKTTLLRAVSGLVPARSGEVVFDGQDITRWAAHVIAAAGVVHIPQGDLLFPEMTVRENLLMG